MGPELSNCLLISEVKLTKGTRLLRREEAVLSNQRGNGTILSCANFIQYWPPRIKCIQAFNLEQSTSFFAFDNWVLLKLRVRVFSLYTSACVCNNGSSQFTPILHLCFSNIHKNWHTHDDALKRKPSGRFFYRLHFSFSSSLSHLPVGFEGILYPIQQKGFFCL